MVKSLIKKHEKLIIYIVLLIITCLIMIPYLTKPAHMAADNYRTVAMGLNNYAYEFSFKDGRIITYLYNMLFYFTHASMEVYIILSCFLGIVVSLISVMVVKSTIEKIKQPKNIKEKIVVIIISYLMIFNIMYLECFYFTEIPIIALSILLMLLATRQIVFRKSWKNVFYAFLLMLLTMFSYQGNVEFLLAFILLNSLLVNKLNWKKAFKDLLIGFAVLLLSGLINVVTVKIICSHLGYRENRLPTSINDIIEMLRNRGLAFVTNQYILQILFIVILYTFQVLKLGDNKSIISWVTLVLLIFLMSAGVKILIPSMNCSMVRTQFTIGAIVMFIFYYLYCHTDYFTNKSIVIVSLLIIYLFINTAIYVTNIYYSKKVNILEKIEAEKIIEEIHDYEIANDTKIENLVIILTKADDKTVEYQKFFEETPVLFKNYTTVNACYIIYSTDSILEYYGFPHFKDVKKVESEEIDIQFDEMFKCIDNTLYMKNYYLY